MTVTKKQVIDTITEALEYHEIMRMKESSNTKAIKRFYEFYDEVNSYLKENLK